MSASALVLIPYDTGLPKKTPAQDFSPEHVQFLTVEQALADYARLIEPLISSMVQGPLFGLFQRGLKALFNGIEAVMVLTLRFLKWRALCCFWLLILQY